VRFVVRVNLTSVLNHNWTGKTSSFFRGKRLFQSSPEHAAALAQLERDMKAKSESLKVDYDRALEEERRQHKAAMKNAREDAEVKTRDAIRRKAAELKKVRESVLRFSTGF